MQKAEIIKFPSTVKQPALKIHSWNFLWEFLKDPVHLHGHLLDAYVDGDLEVNVPLIPYLTSVCKLAKSLHLLPIFYRLSNLYQGKTEDVDRDKDIKHHYDLALPDAEGKVDAAEFFSLFLDSSMAYSMAYWPNGTKTLEEAQGHKLKLLQELMDLKKGDEVYEAGFGYGSLIPYILEKGAHWQGANLSHRQCEWVRKKYPKLQVREQDFLKPWIENKGEKKFDRIISVENVEHIQDLNECFSSFKRMLKSNGKLVIYTMTTMGNTPTLSDSWIMGRLAPHCQLHNHHLILKAASRYFDTAYEQTLEGTHYAKTIEEWLERFEQNLPKMRAMGIPARFIRLWRIYLSASAAAFAANLFQVSIFVFTPRKSQSVRPKLSLQKRSALKKRGRRAK